MHGPVDYAVNEFDMILPPGFEYAQSLEVPQNIKTPPGYRNRICLSWNDFFCRGSTTYNHGIAVVVATLLLSEVWMHLLGHQVASLWGLIPAVVLFGVSGMTYFYYQRVNHVSWIMIAFALGVIGFANAAESLGLTPFFAGLILLALVGNAAELLNAIRFARKDKMDLSFGIVVGAITQIALFVAPVLVFVSPLDRTLPRLKT